MNSTFPSDPVIIGPGMWFDIHLEAKHAITDDQKHNFIRKMNLLKINFPCEKCRKHLAKYIDDHPITDFMNVVNETGLPIGMFKWSWMLHNAVNTRLGKPYVTWDTACGMFNDPGTMVCTRGCEAESKHSTTKIIPTVGVSNKGISLIRALNDSLVTKGSNGNSITFAKRIIET